MGMGKDLIASLLERAIIPFLPSILYTIIFFNLKNLVSHIFKLRNWVCWLVYWLNYKLSLDRSFLNNNAEEWVWPLPLTSLGGTHTSSEGLKQRRVQIREGVRLQKLGAPVRSFALASAWLLRGGWWGPGAARHQVWAAKDQWRSCCPFLPQKGSYRAAEMLDRSWTGKKVPGGSHETDPENYQSGVRQEEGRRWERFPAKGHTELMNRESEGIRKCKDKEKVRQLERPIKTESGLKRHDSNRKEPLIFL